MELKKYIAVVTAIFEPVLFSGLVFGWSSLVFVLKEEGIYSNLCQERNSTVGNTTDVVLPTCSAQDEMLQLAYTIAVTAIPIMNFFIGALFSKFGIRLTRLLGR